MTFVARTMLVLGLACTLAACSPQAGSGRDRQPDGDPLEANRPAPASAAQRPVAPVMTR